MWDSGKVDSSNCVGIRYAGKQLASRREYFWRVHVWDENGAAGDFSQPARFEMALLEPADWTADWISGEAAEGKGYQSKPEGRPDTEKWVQVDLGAARKFSSVALYPAKAVRFPTAPTVPKVLTESYCLPIHYRIEASDEPEFAKSRVLADRGNTDQLAGTSEPIVIDVGDQTARYVRVTATMLGGVERSSPAFALAELEVRDTQGSNIAHGTKASALDSVEENGWGLSRLTDGKRVSQVFATTAMLRREFDLENPVRQARAYVTGLGYYELWINGKRVGDRVLDPARTTYGKRVYYSVYDVTKLLKRGPNCVGAMLGQGWWWDKSLTLLAQVEVTYTDGTRAVITTDQSWRSGQCPITDCWVFGGETYDARLEQPGWSEPGFNDSSWKPVAVAESPTSQLRAQTIQPIKVIETLKPKSVTSPKNGVWVYDFGQNIAGWCRLSAQGEAGTSIRLRHAESLFPDGTINVDNLGPVDNPGPLPQADIFTLKGQGTEVLEPRFVYHGFRYVEVTGFPGTPTLESIEAKVVHTAFDRRGSFSCSNDLLNRIYDACLWTQRDNFHSIPTDCPQRDERGGWLGDAHVSSYAMLYSFDMPPAYNKFLRDIQDVQADDGGIPSCAPDEVYSRPDPMWALAYPLILWRTYVHTGDKGLLAEHYDDVRKYVEMLRREAGEGSIVTRNAYGDWLAYDPTPGDLMSTAAYARTAELLSLVAGELAKQEDARLYMELHQKIVGAFNAKFLDPKTSNYGSGSQLSNSLPLAFGIVPDDRRQAVLANVVKDVEKRGGHLSTGVAGTSYLMAALTDGGRADTAYTVATRKDAPGWGFMTENGGTTIWEYWRLRVDWGVWVSLNHPAQAFLSGWFYEALAGLSPDQGRPGWEHFDVKPHVLGDLKWASAKIETVRGVVESDWKLTAKGIRLKVTVPANSSATVFVPTLGKQEATITESGKPVWRGGKFLPRDGINSGKHAEQWLAFEVGSGHYLFELKEAE